MEIKWCVDDGYVARGRWHYTEVPDDELAECESVEEAQALIEEYVDEDFTQRITWSMTELDEDPIRRLVDVLRAREEEP